MSGTYVLSSAKAHGSNAPDGTKLFVVGKDTIALTATTFDHIQTDDKAKETRSSGTAAASGTSFTLTTTCQFPAGSAKAPQVGSYTATATGLTLLQTQGTGTFELTYTKK